MGWFCLVVVSHWGRSANNWASIVGYPIFFSFFFTCEQFKPGSKRGRDDEASSEAGRDEPVAKGATLLVRHVCHVGEGHAEDDAENTTDGHQNVVGHRVDLKMSG